MSLTIIIYLRPQVKSTLVEGGPDVRVIVKSWSRDHWLGDQVDLTELGCQGKSSSSSWSELGVEN